MLTSMRGLTAATLSAGAILSATPAFASPKNADGIDWAIEAALPTDTQPGLAILAGPVLAPDGTITGLRALAPIDPETSSHLQDGVDAGVSAPVSFSANIAFASEYRFRGVALTDGEFAVQGGFDLGHDSGLYVGTWASNLDETTVGYGSAELDLYGGWGGALAEGVSADIGAIMYLYPDAGPGDFDYVELYGSLTFSLGPAELTGGVAYAPDQDSLGGTDNFYIYSDVGVGIPNTPISLSGHLGYTDGFLTFTTDSKAVDWSIGADFALGPATLSAAYVGVEGDAAIDPTRTFTDDAFVVTLSASF